MATEIEERWAWTTLATVLLLVFGGPAIRSPDGMEMLRLSASWLGQPGPVGDAHFWPPLWSVLNLPAVAAGHGLSGARVLNLLLWGLVIWPVHSLSYNLGGRAAARRAVVLLLALPIIPVFAAVADARALGALITTAFVAAAVSAAVGERGLWAVVLLGALGPLARPEGVLLTVVVGPLIWLLGQGVVRAVCGGVVAALPHVLWSGAIRGLSGHEQLFAPWYGTWSTWDVLSLFGPASMPTEFRRFALAAVEAGVVQPQPSLSDLGRVLSAVPSGLSGAGLALAGGVGVVGLAFAVRGFLRVNRGHQSKWVVLVAVFPALVVAAAPMAKDQASMLSQWLFVLPALVALISVGTAWPRAPAWVPWSLVGLCVLEVSITPLMGAPPYFIEGSQAADLATVMLEQDPPNSGTVATDFSGRDVVIGAGLDWVSLGPVWTGPVPESVDAVLISSVGARGEDGGRGLALLESAQWSVAWVVGDGDLEILAKRTPTQARWDRGWYALLLRP